MNDPNSNTGDNRGLPIRKASVQREMHAYDTLPPDMRKLLRSQCLNFSAVEMHQFLDMVRSGPVKPGPNVLREHIVRQYATISRAAHKIK